jgi:hypothetical protein
MRLLQRVRTFWITDVLEQSLHGAALLALGLQEQPDSETSFLIAIVDSTNEMSKITRAMFDLNTVRTKYFY